MRLSLTPSTDPADYSFVHRIRPRFAETDAMGIIHHSAYVPYLEEARASLLRHAGYPYDEVRSSGIDFAVLELFVRYRRPLYFDDAVDIYVAADELTRTTFQVGYLLQVAGADPCHGGDRPRRRRCRRAPGADAVVAGRGDGRRPVRRLIGAPVGVGARLPAGYAGSGAPGSLVGTGRSPVAAPCGGAR